MNKTQLIFLVLAATSLIHCSSEDDPVFVAPGLTSKWQGTTENSQYKASEPNPDLCAPFKTSLDANSQLNIDLNVIDIFPHGALTELSILNASTPIRKFFEVGRVTPDGVVSLNERGLTSVQNKAGNFAAAEGATFDAKGQVTLIDTNTLQFNTQLTATVLGKVSANDSSETRTRLSDAEFKKMYDRAMWCLKANLPK